MRPWGVLAIATAALLVGGCALLPAPSGETGTAAPLAAQGGKAGAADPGAADPGAAVRPPAAETPTAETPPAVGHPSPAGPEDLWHWIAGRLHWPRHLERPEVQAEIAWWRRHPGHVQRVLAAAAPTLPVILPVLERAGLPMELALLPAVESGYRPQARSPSGAAGLWQFMPDTARRHGLRRNWWYDARLDVTPATAAAVRHLSALRDQFDGDWLLALAAYNAGPARVRRTRAANARRGRPTDYWHLALPRETRRYVPRLLALAELVAHAGEHGVALPETAPAPPPVAVDTGGPIDLAQAATLAGLSLEELRALNPALRRWATPPDGPHRLWLPPAAAERLRTALSRLPPSARVAWDAHRVVSGDSLWRLSRAYDIPIAELRRINGLSGSRLRVGQVLKVPRVEGATRQRLAVGPPPRAPAVVHTVSRGESLWTIARRHGVTVEALRAWNGLAPGSVLRPGQRLHIGGTQRDGEA